MRGISHISRKSLREMGKNITSERPVSLWRNRDYLLLWLGQAISSLGTGISQFAFPLLVLALTHAFAAAGFAGALGQLPYLLFSLPAGAMVDRWDRKRVMIVCTLGLALCIASIPVAILSGHLTHIQLYIVSFLMGTLFVFYELAELAALTQVVPKVHLSTAVAQNEAVFSTVSLLAPSLGGVLLSIGKLFPFVADGISYLVLLGSLLRIRSTFQEERSTDSYHLLRDVRAGISWLWSHVVVRSLAFLAGYLDVARIGGILIVYAIARQHQISLILVGVILTAGGCGNLTGTVLSSLIQRRIRFGWALGSMLILFVLLWPLYGVASSSIFLGIVVAGLALIDSISAILISSYRLAMVPDELQGRVGSVYRLIVFGSLALGQVVVGQCLDHFGILMTVGILWSGLILFALLMLASSQLRQASSLQEQ